jgi:hypothetical protein
MNCRHSIPPTAALVADLVERVEKSLEVVAEALRDAATAPADPTEQFLVVLG